MPTWFLPPDFTFTSEGPIKLGTVLAHPARPTLVLASLSSDSSITLPKESTIVEPNHSHEKSASRSVSVNIWAKFFEIASVSAKTEARGQTIKSYGTVDHEIHSFTDPFTPPTVTAITALPDIKKHIDSGIFGKKPVYIVTGLRIAKQSFTVKQEVASNLSGEISGSGSLAGVTVPVEVNTGLSGSRERKTMDSYDTAPGIVFAYRLFIIRTKRAGVEVELFSDKGAFLTGDSTDVEQPFIVAEATKEEIEEDLEEPVSFETWDGGEDDYCISF
jgi:hypothetical protein